MKEKSLIRSLESLSMIKGDEPQLVAHIALGMGDIYSLISCLKECAEKSDDFDSVADAVDYCRFYKHCKDVAYSAKKHN